MKESLKPREEREKYTVAKLRVRKEDYSEGSLRISQSIKRKCEFDMTSEAERRPAKSTWNQTFLMLYFLINIHSIAFLFLVKVNWSDSVSHCEHSIDADHADHCAVKFLKTFLTFFLVPTGQWRKPGAEFGGTEKFFADQDDVFFWKN